MKINNDSSIAKLNKDVLDNKSQLAQIETEFQQAVGAITADSEVVLARNSAVKGKTFTTLDPRLEEIENDVLTLQNKTASYGLRWTISTDTYTRLDNAVGKVANISGAGANNFDSILPWSGMRRCNVPDDFIVTSGNKTTYKVNAYYGEAGYIEDGSNGQVMVEVPAFYYKVVIADADNIEWYVSMLPLAGYKLHPWFYDAAGTPVTKKYFSAYEGSIYDVSNAVAEVNTLTITAGCSTAGNVTILLDNYITVTVALTTADNTAALVAAKIAAATYMGWTVSVNGAVVTFTCGTAGAKNTLVYTAGSTGATGTVVKTTSGAGGYVTGDAQVADFTATTGDKLCSIAGMKPCSGFSQMLYISNSRILANNRGSGWQQAYFTAVSALQLLYSLEYAGFNSQSKIGSGVTNITDDSTNNMSIKTGYTATLGNKSGISSALTHHRTGQTCYAASYRGIENLWGNIISWVDGINILNGVAHVTGLNGSFISDKTTAPYYSKGILSNTNGFMSAPLINNNFDFGFIPFASSGSSSTKFADNYYQNASGAFVAQLGGYWGSTLSAGIFNWAMSGASNARSRTIGTRLCI